MAKESLEERVAGALMEYLWILREHKRGSLEEQQCFKKYQNSDPAVARFLKAAREIDIDCAQEEMSW